MSGGAMSGLEARRGPEMHQKVQMQERGDGRRSG